MLRIHSVDCSQSNHNHEINWNASIQSEWDWCFHSFDGLMYQQPFYSSIRSSTSKVTSYFFRFVSIHTGHSYYVFMFQSQERRHLKWEKKKTRLEITVISSLACSAWARCLLMILFTFIYKNDAATWIDFPVNIV